MNDSPSHWQVANLLETTLPGKAGFDDGDWIEARYISDEGIRLIQTGNIGISEFIDRPEHRKFISDQTFETLRCKWVHPGDILICRLAEPIGRACVVPTHVGRSITAVDCTIYRPNPSVADRNYVLHWLNTDWSLKAAQEVAGGTTRQRISRMNLGTLRIKLPPVQEQSRIAAVLDTVDEAIAKTEAVIAKLKQVRAGLLHDLLTRGLDEHGQLRDPIAHPEQFKDSPLGRIPREWRVRRLCDIATFQNGKAFPSSDYQETGIRLLRPGNLPPSEFVSWGPGNTTCLPESWGSLASDYLVEGDELVMNLTAQSLEDQFLGRVCMTRPSERCLLNQRLARFRVLDCDLSFLFWSLRGPFFRPQIDRNPQGTKVQHIYNRDLEAVVLPMPESLQEQEQVSSALFAAARQTEAEESLLAKLQKLKSGLMTDLLTGRVCVPEGIVVAS